MKAPRLTNWKQTDYYRNFDWVYGSQRVTVGSDARIDYERLPDAWKDIQSFKDFYKFNDSQVAGGATVTTQLRRLIRERDGVVLSRSTEVAIYGRLDLRKGDAVLILSIDGHGKTWPEAFSSVKVSVDRLYHLGPVEPGGTGQIKRLRALAKRLAADNRDALSDSTAVLVYGETRGGRGGWKTKTIVKAWRTDELLGEAATA